LAFTSLTPLCTLSSFTCYRDHRDLHSFPTRRSSDLVADVAGQPPRAGRGQVGRGDGRVRVAGFGAPQQLQAHAGVEQALQGVGGDRKSTRLNSSHVAISYAVFCLKKKKKQERLNLCQ